MFRLLARGSSFTCVFLSVLPPSYFDWFLVSFYHATTGYSILAGATELTAITCILEQDRAVVFMFSHEKCVSQPPHSVL